MKTGIVIAVPKYQDPADDLPACADDLAGIRCLLDHAGYTDVLFIEEPLPAAEIKEMLAAWVRDRQSAPVSELVFYYTGHGDFDGDEFYFTLHDYDRKRRRQTALENSELDQLLRSLSPGLAFKIVDACHSGVQYVKSPRPKLHKYWNTSGGSFEKCYFMYSSTAQQSSFQDDKMSFFTRSILEAVRKHPGNDIRHKDIIDYVADQFAGDPDQTPTFVTQADFTEIFCPITLPLQTQLGTFLDKAGASGSAGKDADRLSLVKLVEADATRYRDQVHAERILKGFLKELQTTFASLPEPLDDLFACLLNAHETVAQVPKPTAIGEWLEKNNQFFARPRHETKIIRKKTRNRWRAQLALITWADDDEYVEVPVDELVGFTPSSRSAPYFHVEIRFEPKFDNLPRPVVHLVPLVSPTGIQLFSCSAVLQRRNWKDFSVDADDLTWRTRAIEWTALEKDASAVAQALLDWSCSTALDALRAQFPDAMTKTGEASTDAGEAAIRPESPKPEADPKRRATTRFSSRSSKDRGSL